MFKPKLYLLLAFLLCTTLLPAQRVAVVFSGGGAKGLVHLGALKALEENQIPVDAVVGTSIGAIVGGMYAAGYSVDEIVNFLQSKDFKKWSTGSFEHEGSYYYRQREDDAEMFSLRMNIDRSGRVKFVLPTNLVPPYQMDFAFMQLFAGATAAAKNSLDSLMIPFRAVSYDTYNERPYVPARGDVGTLIRASMSFPGIFKPAVVDSLLLFDGGMVNNFPVNVAEKDFSPDFIIGVKCTEAYERPTEDDVFSHLTNLMLRRVEYEIAPSRGVLISVDSLRVDLMDFTKVKMLVDAGYRETMQQMPTIKSRVQRRISAEEMQQKRLAFRKKIPPLRFDSVSVNGVNEGLKSYVTREMLSEKKEGKTFSLGQIKRSYFGVVADEAVNTFFPTASFCAADSAYNINLRATAAPNLRLAFGGSISTFSNLGFFSGEYQRLFSKMRLRVGGNVYFGNVYNSLKFYNRIDTRNGVGGLPLFYELNITRNNFDYYSNNPDMIFSDTRPDFLRDNEAFGKLSLGTRFVRNSALRLSFAGGSRGANYYTHANFSSVDISEEMRFNFLVGSLSIDCNTLNIKQLPTSGVLEQVSIGYVWGSENHTFGTTAVGIDSATLGKNQFKGHRRFWTLKYMRQDYAKWRHFGVGYHVEAVWSEKAPFSDYYSTLLMLPAFAPLPNLPGFFLERFRASAYVAAGLIPTFALSERFFLRTEAYFFQPLTVLSKENVMEPVRYKSELRMFSLIGAATLVFNTPVGPLAASISYYDKQGQNIYFAISFGYNLHNKRAFNN
ncbi:MAG: patatin-like phospholipase family protein [Prevotellaceae bacterium]|jgi:NTE family protein|nr:patatin-like phospholipase family protein [Prevotellaceae bacterium]